MQQALLRYYGNALKDLTCHNMFVLFAKQTFCYTEQIKDEVDTHRGDERCFENVSRDTWEETSQET
jgi:hypothetical protein